MNIDYFKKISSDFQKELSLSNKGYKTSLPFIINPIPTKNIVSEKEIFQVMVIGGTIFKSALVQKNKYIVKIIKEKKDNLPLFLTKDSFISYVFNNLEKGIKFLAVNFTFGVKPVSRNGILDGSNPLPSKKHLFTGFGNEKIGQSIEKYIFKKTGKPIKVSVANDTICLLLSSLAKMSWNKVVAGIAGTGINFAFFLNKNKAVNIESANFNNFTQTQTGRIINLSHGKGLHLFEKETAGVYLYQHFNILIKERNIHYPKLTETSQLSQIAIKKDPFVSKIAGDLLKRSAKFLSCQIAGITKFKKQDMTFVMEGSLFWKGYKYKEAVRETVKQLVPQYKVEFIKIENSDILGAAKLLC